MAVYVDEIVKHPTPIKCFQGGNTPHYDLTPARRAAALKAGAVFKSAREQARERIAARIAQRETK